MKSIKHAATTTAGTSSALLEISHLGKVYGGKGVVTTAIEDITLAVREGEFVAIMGPSGSGKSTLLNCIATIDMPTSGSIKLDGRDVTRLRSGELARFRRDELGFVFQDANLLDTLTAYENIALALTLKGERPTAIRQAITEIATTLGIEEVLGKFPSQMSGGQRQRVAAARAVVTHPKLILADEPTGALDSKSSTVLLETLSAMNGRFGATILMVTHDAYAASYSDRTVFIRDGRVFNDVRRGADSRGTYYQRLMEVMAFLGGDADAR